MASLTEVVEELKGQNNTLEDVKSALKGMLDIDLQKQKDDAAQELIDKEKAIEARRSKAKVSTKPPQTFGAGLSSGLGLDALTGGIRGLLGPFLGTLGGAFGGLTIGGLLGAAVGNLFRLGVGALLGKEYITPLFEKYLPTWLSDFKLFGEGEDALTAADVGGYVTGAAALLFGPKILGQLISKGFGGLGRTIFSKTKGLKGDDFIGPQQKASVGKKVKGRAKMLGAGLVRNIGLAGILGIVGEAVGDGIASITGSEELGSSITSALEAAAVGALFFGPVGAITLGIASLAISGLSFLGDFFKEQDKKIRDDALNKLKPFENMAPEEIKNLTSEEIETFKDDAAAALSEAKRRSTVFMGGQEAELNKAYKEKVQEIVANVAVNSDSILNTDEVNALINQIRDEPSNVSAINRLARDLIVMGATDPRDIGSLVRNTEGTSQYGTQTAQDIKSASMIIDAITTAIEDIELNKARRGALPELPLRPLGSEPKPVQEPFGAPLGGYAGEARVDQPGGFPAPIGLESTRSQISIQPNQIIDAESALVAGNQNNMVFAPNNSDNRQTIINRAGDSPMRLAPIKSSTDDNFLSKRNQLMGAGVRVGNAY